MGDWVCETSEGYSQNADRRDRSSDLDNSFDESGNRTSCENIREFKL